MEPAIVGDATHDAFALTARLEPGLVTVSTLDELHEPADPAVVLRGSRGGGRVHAAAGRSAALMARIVTYLQPPHDGH